MSSQIHSPGPWSWDREQDVIFDYEANRVVDMCDRYCNSFCPESHNANARLIAAAPELLSVAEDFLREWRTAGFHEVSHEDLAQAAERAITKAKGGA